MDGKIVLLMIAVLAVGMFALPSTLALYSGQHTFFNGSEVSCDKCHGAASDVTFNGGVAGEFGADIINGSKNKTHSSLDCGDCHTSTAGQGTTYHAATAAGAGCVACHSTSGLKGTLIYGNITAQLVLPGEVHNSMTTDEATGTQDYACIACHTAATVMGSVVNLTDNYSGGNISLNTSAADPWNNT